MIMVFCWVAAYSQIDESFAVLFKYLQYYSNLKLYFKDISRLNPSQTYSTPKHS